MSDSTTGQRQGGSDVTPPSTTETAYDAIVIGAGHSGLIAAGILAKNGLDTILVDEIDQVGGRGGASEYHGYWFNFGRRDARDFADMVIGMCGQQYAKLAADAAGADIDWVEEPSMRVHQLAKHKVVEPGDSSGSGMGEMASAFGIPDDQVQPFSDTLASLAKEPPEKIFSLTFRDWLPTLPEPLRPVFQSIAVDQFSIPWEETSVGRFVDFMTIGITAYTCNDPQSGNLQGVMAAHARALEANGGTIRLNTKLYEILLEDGRATGVVTRDLAGAVQVLRAPAVVYAQPAWDVFDLVPESAFPGPLVADLKKLVSYDGDTAQLHLGLRRLPTVKASGRRDDFGGWNRVLRGESLDYGGGWHIPSILSPSCAPVGKHLLSAVFGTSGPGPGGRGYPGLEPFDSYADAKGRLDLIVEYARDYYADLDEVTEFATYQIIKAPTTMGASWKPIRRVPVELAEVPGLYFVANTTEVSGTYHDIGAHAALIATDLITKRAAKP